MAAIALACAGFAAGATWGAARTRVAIEAEHLDEVTKRDPVYVLTASCTLLTAVQNLIEGPGELHVAELDAAVDRAHEAESRLARIDFERGEVIRRLRSPWWFHSFDAVADRSEEYRAALQKLSFSVGDAHDISRSFEVSRKVDSAALTGMVGNLRDAIEQTAGLIHDDPQNWPCWRRAAGL